MEAPTRFALEGESIAVGATSGCPYVFVRLNREWQLALIGAAGDRGGGELDVRAPGHVAPALTSLERIEDGLVLSGATSSFTVEARWVLMGASVVRVTMRLEARERIGLEHALATYWFVPEGKPYERYRQTTDRWQPTSVEGPTPVAPVLVEAEGLGVALVPVAMPAHAGLGPRADVAFGDPRRSAPRLRLGWIADQPGFVLEPGETLVWSYDVLARPADGRGATLDAALRRRWQTHDRPPPPDPRWVWGQHAEHLYARALAEAWLAAPGGTGGFRFAEGHATIAFGAEANALRTAYGLRAWGEALDRPEWRRAAKAIRTLARKVPEASGLFPCVHDVATASDLGTVDLGGVVPPGAGAGGPELAISRHLATSGRWMLRAHAELGTDRPLLLRAQGIGELLAASQLPSGAFPAAFRLRDRAAFLPSGREAESAWVVALLAELASVTGRSALLRAAVRGAGMLAREILPTRAYHAGATEGATELAPPQMPAVILAVAEALALVHEATGDDRWLGPRARALDDLEAHQALVAEGPVPYGGFPTSTAVDRPSPLVATELLVAHGVRFGSPEHVARGLASLDASLALAGQGLATPFDAYGGAALAVAAALVRRFGTVHVDVPRGFAIGLDGFRATAERDPRPLRVELEETLGVGRDVALVLAGLPDGAGVRWNDRQLLLERGPTGFRASFPIGARRTGLLEIS